MSTDDTAGWKAAIGRETAEFRVRAEPARLTQFCRAVHARDRGVAPPTFVTAAREGEFGMLNELGVPLKRLIHAEQEYRYAADILPGDEIVYRTRLQDVLEKRGGSGGMAFFILETDFHAEREGKRIALGSARTNLLTRLAPEGSR